MSHPFLTQPLSKHAVFAAAALAVMLTLGLGIESLVDHYSAKTIAAPTSPPMPVAQR